MMRLKLIGAMRASFKGGSDPVTKGQTVDVDDTTGTHLLEQVNRDALNNPHHLWELLSTTDGDSAVELEEEVVEEELEGDEVDAEVEAETVEAPRRRTPAKAKTKAAPARSRKPAAG